MGSNSPKGRRHHFQFGVLRYQGPSLLVVKHETSKESKERERERELKEGER